MYSTPLAVLHMPSFVIRGLAWLKTQMPSFDPKNFLPFGIEIQTAAVILGNSATPNLLLAEFRNAFGTYGVVPVSLLSSICLAPKFKLWDSLGQSMTNISKF